MKGVTLEEKELLNCGVEQSAARLAHNQEVAGSSPAPATISHINTESCMENQHRKIAGYRELIPEEIDLMNRVKAAGDLLLGLQQEVWARLNTDLERKRAAACNSKLTPEDEASPESVEYRRFNAAEPHRWAAIAKTDIQTGVMALVRAVAQPSQG